MARNRDDNLDYWRKREEEARQNTIKDEAEYNKRLDGIYNSMQVNIEKEINGFYSRYATKNGISMAEAKKRVQNADMEALSRKAEKYVREKDFSDKANEEMALYNLAMKTNRLELLKAQIELELIDGFNDVEHEMEKDLLKTSMKEYERMAGILGKSVKDAEKHAHELVNTSFRNAHFSDRVWYSEWSLKVELERLLRIGLIQGRNPNVLMRDVEKALKVSKYEARRVMVTEMCRVQTGAQKQTYERNGYDQYTFIVEHDDRLCDDCRDLDGQIFYVKDMAPGHNAPPIHCFCRCSTSAYADRARLDALIAQIEAERKGGKAGGDEERRAVNVPQFEPAKTIKDAEKFVSQWVDNSQFGALGISYKGVGLDVANEINEALNTFYGTFKAKKLGGIAAPAKNTKLGKMVSAHMGYSPIRKSIVLNRDNTKKADKFLESLMEDKRAVENVLNHPEHYDLDRMSKRVRNVIENSRESGRGLVPETIQESVYHELGHFLEDHVSKDEWKDLTAGQDKYGSKISGYATDSKSEYFAESFASYMKGEDKIDPKLREWFDGMRK